MTDSSDDDLAYRRRMQSQAIYHLIGKSVNIATMARFQQAGTWPNDDVCAIEAPHEITEVIADPQHARRPSMPLGPLLAIEPSPDEPADRQFRTLVDVADFLFAREPTVRQSAWNHFVSSRKTGRGWLTPFTYQVLDDHEALIVSNEPHEWTKAALAIRDAVTSDFEATVAGVRQAMWLRDDDHYQKYLGRAFRPPLRSFEHFRPPTWNPKVQRDEIHGWLDDWVTSESNLPKLLDRYLKQCGYLPLAKEYSAAALVHKWVDAHPHSGIWETVWQWADQSQTPLASFHACCIFLINPSWIDASDLGRLEDTCRKFLSAGQDDSVWMIRADVLRHYQQHFETMLPAMDSEVMSTYAAWTAERVSCLFGTDPEGLKQIRKLLIKRELTLSTARWSIGRTQMAPSSLRCANLHSLCTWGDALLATISKNWPQLQSLEWSDAFRELVLKRIAHGVMFGTLRTTVGDAGVYMFDQAVLASDLNISSDLTTNEHEEAARQFLMAQSVVESENATKTLLADLTLTELGYAAFAAVALRSLAFRGELANEEVIAALADSGWRHSVFQRLTDVGLDAVFGMLIEWQLHQDSKWRVHVPHLLVDECDRAETGERRELLFNFVLASTMAAGIVSPIQRCLAGPHRQQMAVLVTNYARLFRSVALQSEPWIASRVRGLLGSIHLPEETSTQGAITRPTLD